MRTVLSSGDDSLASFLPTTLLLNPISGLLLFVSWLLLWLYISVGDTCTFSDFLAENSTFRLLVSQASRFSPLSSAKFL